MRPLLYILLLIAAPFLANLVYVNTGLYEADIKKCNAELIYALDSAVSKNNILYFGESSNFTYSENDSCKESIAQLLGKLDSQYRITAISKGAIHAETYKYLIRRIPEGSAVKAIVLTVNLRSFGINWIESELETNLSRANVIYSNHWPVVKKFMLSFKAYDNVELFKRKDRIKSHYRHDKFKLEHLPYTTVRDWDAEVFNKGIADANGNKDQAQTDVACHFIKNYAFVLDENNPRIKDLDAIVDYCHAHHIRLLFHLLPENYSKAAALCGSDLETLMRSNVAFLKTRYAGNTAFVDNFDLLGDSCFIDKSWPTEHYICFGRNSVAQKIQEKLGRISE